MLGLTADHRSLGRSDSADLRAGHLIRTTTQSALRFEADDTSADDLRSRDRLLPDHTRIGSDDRSVPARDDRLSADRAVSAVAPAQTARLQEALGAGLRDTDDLRSGDILRASVAATSVAAAAEPQQRALSRAAQGLPGASSAAPGCGGCSQKRCPYRHADGSFGTGARQRARRRRRPARPSSTQPPSRSPVNLLSRTLDRRRANPARPTRLPRTVAAARKHGCASTPHPPPRPPWPPRPWSLPPPSGPPRRRRSRRRRRDLPEGADGELDVIDIPAVADDVREVRCPEDDLRVLLTLTGVVNSGGRFRPSPTTSRSRMDAVSRRASWPPRPVAAAAPHRRRARPSQSPSRRALR